MATLLPTNYKDDILDTSVNDKRKFRMINNADGTVSFEDATVYITEGTEYGASDVNRTNTKVNKLSNKMDFLTGGFLLKGTTVDLSTKTFNVADERITVSSMAFVFFASADVETVASANVIANTFNGGISFTSDYPVSGLISCDIYVVAEDTESEE